MTQQCELNSQDDLKELIDFKKNEIVAICKNVAEEVAENEFDLFEFDLFLASFGKEKLDESTKMVKELRKKTDKGEIDLTNYEDLLDKY